jgi:hypothetical protein
VPGFVVAELHTAQLAARPVVKEQVGGRVAFIIECGAA